MSNSFSFTGNLGKDAEVKTIGETPVANFSVANTTGFGDRKKTSWYPCSLWGNKANNLAQYLTKGKQVFVIGELTINEKDGKNYPSVRVIDINFIGGKSESSNGGDEPAPSSPETSEEMPF